MLTISGMHKGETKLTIPNQVVREQLFAYILDTYHENDLTFDGFCIYNHRTTKTNQKYPSVNL